MKKTIIIRDFENNPTMVTIEDFETVSKIYIDIITGDEILHVIRKDFSEDVYDSSNCRVLNFADGCYSVYWPERGINLLDEPKWCKCENSYDRMLLGYEEVLKMDYAYWAQQDYEEEKQKKINELLERLKTVTEKEYYPNSKISKFGDREDWHVEADNILCELLGYLGYHDFVEAFEEVPKWYA